MSDITMRDLLDGLAGAVPQRSVAEAAAEADDDGMGGMPGASLGGIVLVFDDPIDATDVQDFAITSGQADATDVEVAYLDNGAATVTFGPGLLADNPELLLGILQAYAEQIADADAGAEAWNEAVAAATDPALYEATKKDKGVFVKFNAFHDEMGRMTSRNAAVSLSYGKAGDHKKWKYTGKGSFGGKATKTKQPCGRLARELGGNIRCFDGQVITPISKGKVKKAVGRIAKAAAAMRRK